MLTTSFLNLFLFSELLGRRLEFEVFVLLQGERVKDSS